MQALPQRRFKACLITICMVAVPILGHLSTRTNHAQSGVSYTITDLGTLGGIPNQSAAWGINNCGTVVGDSVPAVSNSHPFYSKGATMTDLGVDGTAFAVNSFGYTVGTASGPSAFIWHDDNADGVSNPGELQSLAPISGDNGCGALGVNDNNQVVGVSNNAATFTDRAFLWQNGVTQLIPASGGITPAAASGINNSGHIVGQASTASGSHGFFLGPTMVDLGTFGGSSSYAWKVNEDDYVVGYAFMATSNASVPYRAFMWHDDNGNGVRDTTPTDEMRNLGTLGGEGSYAFDLNADRYVVGYSQMSSGETHAFVWHDDNNDGQPTAGELKDLNTLVTDLSGWTELVEAHAINDSGQIVGWGTKTNGETHAFLLMPTGVTPPPCSLPSTAISNISGTGTYGSTATLNATLMWNGTPLSGKSISFTLNGTPVGSANTNASGVATVSGVSLTGINAGSHSNAVGASFAGDLNYESSSGTGTITVNKVTLTVTAENKSKTYLASNPALTFTPTGFVNGDTAAVLSGAPSFSTTTSNSPVGSYPITITQGTLSATNYSFNFVNGTLTINKATPVINWSSPSDITYGTALSSTQLNAVATNPNDSSSVAGTRSYTPATGTLLHPGNGQMLHVDFTPTDTTNYNPASKNVLINVIKATLTVTAENKSKSYRAANPSLTFTTTGFVNGDTASVLSGAPSLTTTATTTSSAGSYPITISQGTLSAAEYAFNFVNGTLTINKATPAINWSNPLDITYGTALSGTQLNATATNPNDSSSVTGTFTYTPATATVLHAGNGQTIHADFAPTDTTNYNTPAQNTVLINVTRATLTVTAENKSKSYRTANPGLTFTTTGFVNGDTASVLSGAPSLTTTATITSAAGSYPITITQGTLAAADYTFTFVNGALTINKATPLISWSNPADINYGTGLSSAQLNAAATDPNDSSSVAGTFTYTPTTGTVLHAGSGQTVRADFAPADSANYNSPAQQTVSINVLKAALTITADNKVKLVGDANPPLTFTGTGFVNGDMASVLAGAPSLSTTATQSSPVGNYAITIIQGTLAAADYNLSFVSGTLSVTEPAPALFVDLTNPTLAAVVDSVTFVNGPFRVANDFNFSSDHLTRIIIFTSPLGLTPSPPVPPASTLSVQASGIDLPIESVGTITGVGGLNASYIVVRLRPELTGSGPINYDLTITRRGVTSNAAALTIIP